MFFSLISPENTSKHFSAHEKTQAEIKQLIEAGFEYATQKEGLAYFRKSK